MCLKDESDRPTASELLDSEFLNKVDKDDGSRASNGDLTKIVESKKLKFSHHEGSLSNCTLEKFGVKKHITGGIKIFPEFSIKSNTSIADSQLSNSKKKPIIGSFIKDGFFLT